MPYFEIFGKNKDSQEVYDSANSETTFLWWIAVHYLITNWANGKEINLVMSFKCMEIWKNMNFRNAENTFRVALLCYFGSFQQFKEKISQFV